MAPGGNQVEVGGEGGGEAGSGNGGSDHGRPPTAPRRRGNWWWFLALILFYSTWAIAILVAWDAAETFLAVDPKLSDTLRPLPLMLLSAGMAAIVQQMWSHARR